jgi:hypothetical protein
LTTGERNQLGVDLSIVVAQRARQGNGRREDPNAQFIAQVLGYEKTPYGLIERQWINAQLRAGSQAIQRCSCINRQCVRVGPHLVRSCGRLGRMGNRRRWVGRRPGSTTSRRSWNWRRYLSAERQWHDEVNLQLMQGVRAFETKIAQSAA